MQIEIRQAAIDLFSEVGADFTLEQLEARSGVPRATLYRRIGSKKKLLARLASEGAIRPDDHRDIEERVISAAANVVAEHGFLACTMDKVAKEAGIGIATLYRRFKDKDGLLDRLGAQMAPKPVVRQAHEASEPDLERDLRRMIEIGLRFGVENQDTARIVFAARAAEQKFVEKHKRNSADGFCRVVQYLQLQQESGKLRQDVPAMDLAMALNGFILQYALYGPAYLERTPDMENDPDTILKLFLQTAQSA